MTDRSAAEVLTLRLGGPAAGGTCVAHGAGSTWFVRGGLPGELVTARVTNKVRRGRLGFASVEEVLEPSPFRVIPPCALAGVCGGCDLQHVAADYQPIWKAEVLRDQLLRIGGITHIGDAPLAEALPTVTPLRVLGWRTRFAVDTNAAGDACFHAPRSSDLVPVANCPVVADALQDLFAHDWPADVRVHASESLAGPTVAPLPTDVGVPVGWRSATTVTRRAGGRSWRVATDGFWQSHTDAADILVAAVAASLGFASAPAGHGRTNLVDLYSGVGLFAGTLVASGAFGQATAVDGDASAVRLARRNLHDLPAIQLVAADVKTWVVSTAGQEVLAAADAVVLDPPRIGAGPKVTQAVAESGASTICYVACDGASLARDAKQLVGTGWRFDGLDAFDLYGMSHHVEAVARFVRR